MFIFDYMIRIRNVHMIDSVYTQAALSQMQSLIEQHEMERDASDAPEPTATVSLRKRKRSGLK